MKSWFTICLKTEINSMNGKERVKPPVMATTGKAVLLEGFTSQINFHLFITSLPFIDQVKLWKSVSNLIPINHISMKALL